MKLSEYDEVLLNDGSTAIILEILGDNECYVAEIHYSDQSKDIDGFSTEFLYPKDIAKVLKTDIASAV